ncbi:MAG: TolB protein, partial [Mariprofundaceae bacterium]
ILFAMLIAAPAVQAENLFDWLQTASKSKKQKQAEAMPADHAVLLTLEPQESEMYPKLSSDGRSMLVTTEKGKHSWVSRRAVENGDPLNVVTDDVRALDSARWHNGSVTFLSKRTGGLGLWKKAADGQGIVRRVKELQGQLTQVHLLEDGSVIAVRLESTGRTKKKARTKHDSFNNWQVSGYKIQIIHVDPFGKERVLSEGSNPALSRDREWLIFSMPVGRSSHLFMMRVDGSELSQLTDERSIDVQPVWSADGKWIVFTSNRAKSDMRKPGNNNWDIWAVDREGRNLTQLTMDKARDGAPSVGADNRVYFHSDRKISSELKKEHQIKGRVGSFHIWSVPLEN